MEKDGGKQLKLKAMDEKTGKGRDFLYGKGQSVFPELFRLYNHC